MTTINWTVSYSISNVRFIHAGMRRRFMKWPSSLPCSYFLWELEDQALFTKIGADQFDDDHLEERKQKISFFDLWNFSLCRGALLGVTFIVYVQDYVNCDVAYLTLSIKMGIATTIFYIGKPFY
ncbi:unnamed protein product [Fraxinus pennsylvanica]|uniref:Uncharacterized protein n=1 Tax=Fraxinus pennsylvanica TaxID=56036 RepID=A0AAD1ZDZ5_9LAMI|nr:unnamed protein product [Fraxinus pennsylvanica]